MMAVIEEADLSVAWARAYRATATGLVTPLVVTITGLEKEMPSEQACLRSYLDHMLENSVRAVSVNSTANTIFPSSLWNPQKPKELLFKRFNEVWPHISRCPKNRYGHYFRRMTSYGEKDGDKVNQLDHVINTWLGGNHRKSALQAAIFDPSIDHTNQHQRGFPCLQQVAFVPMGTSGREGLRVVGFYPQQHIVDRAYGNYLGLCRLCIFMAQEMHLRPKAMTCVIACATQRNPKTPHSRALDEAVRDVLNGKC